MTIVDMMEQGQEDIVAEQNQVKVGGCMFVTMKRLELYIGPLVVLRGYSSMLTVCVRSPPQQGSFAEQYPAEVGRLSTGLPYLSHG